MENIKRLLIWIVGLLLSVLFILFNAFYFDYSDRWIHTIFALAFFTTCFFAPRIGCSLAIIYSGLIFTGYLFDNTDLGDFSPQLRLGLTPAEVEIRLGKPDFVLSTVQEAFDKDLGYSKPSPLRIDTTEGPVYIYTKGDQALWLFYLDGKFSEYYIGGS